MPKKRTDAERRARQCERIGRVISILRLILGPGRWDADALAKELECSRRTVHRDLQTLSMAGVPWFFDDECHAYRVRPGFRFPGLESTLGPETGRSSDDQAAFVAAAKKLLADAEGFTDSLREFCSLLEKPAGKGSSADS